MVVKLQTILQSYGFPWSSSILESNNWDRNETLRLPAYVLMLVDGSYGDDHGWWLASTGLLWQMDDQALLHDEVLKTYALPLNLAIPLKHV